MVGPSYPRASPATPPLTGSWKAGQLGSTPKPADSSTGRRTHAPGCSGGGKTETDAGSTTRVEWFSALRSASARALPKGLLQGSLMRSVRAPASVTGSRPAMAPPPIAPSRLPQRRPFQPPADGSGRQTSSRPRRRLAGWRTRPRRARPSRLMTPPAVARISLRPWWPESRDSDRHQPPTRAMRSRR